MFSRITTFTGAKDVDAGITFLRDQVAPLMRQQNGFKGLSASVDRSGGVFAALSLWDTEANRDASESALAKTREEAQRVIGGQVTVESFEEVLLDAAAPPGVGSALLVRRISMDPAKVDENLDFFKREILPAIKSEPGYLALRQLINRKTGEGVVGTAWADKASAEAAGKAAAARQGQGEQRGVTFGERSLREIVFVDIV